MNAPVALKYGCVACLMFGWVAVANAVCVRDAECDDRLFCNGRELCRPHDSHADSAGCIPGERRCMTDPSTVCNEAEARCDAPPCIDKDGDGHSALGCGGDDCDDDDQNRYPGNIEVCDRNGHDEDCNRSTPGTRDADNDGFVDIECFNYKDQFFRGVQR